MKNLLIVLTFLTLCSCTNSSGGNADSSASYETAKLTVEDNERQNPLQFLDAKTSFRQNLLGEWVVEGEIINRANIVTYKDVQLKFNFITQTNTEIGSVDRTVIKFFKPSSTETFKFRLDGPRGTGRISFEIVNASVAN